MKYKWHIGLGLALVAVSAATYLAQVAVFHKPQDTFFYMLQDFAFVPIQVLLVTLILTELMSLREKSRMREKMNMVIGAFFAEMGEDLLKSLMAFDNNVESLRHAIAISPESTRRDFADTRKLVRERTYEIDSRRASLEDLRAFLARERTFVLGLLENQNLLEHESFTDLLWAVSHVSEELDHRTDLSALPNSDYAHLSADIARAYKALIDEWLGYALHLSERYPFMYSLVVRTNPFDADARAEVMEMPRR